MAKNTNKTDLRIQRTQKAIVDAFYELLDEKSFGSITVIDICERALINRGTFYTHFEDKYQLLDKCISDVMYGLHEQVKQVHGDSDLITYYNEVMSLGINFLAQYRKRLRTIILKADSALVFDKVHEILTHNIVNRLSKAKPKDGAGKIPADILPRAPELCAVVPHIRLCGVRAAGHARLTFVAAQDAAPPNFVLSFRATVMRSAARQGTRG